MSLAMRSVLPIHMTVVAAPPGVTEDDHTGDGVRALSKNPFPLQRTIFALTSA
jgi:hypothetical protein